MKTKKLRKFINKCSKEDAINLVEMAIIEHDINDDEIDEILKVVKVSRDIMKAETFILNLGDAISSTFGGLSQQIQTGKEDGNEDYPYCI